MQYPQRSEIPQASHEQLLRWNRFLPSPQTPEQVAIINDIYDLVRASRDSDPSEHTQASKRIGW